MWARNSPEVGFGERETPKAREPFSPFEVASGREALGFSRSPTPDVALLLASAVSASNSPLSCGKTPRQKALLILIVSSCTFKICTLSAIVNCQLA